MGLMGNQAALAATWDGGGGVTKNWSTFLNWSDDADLGLGFIVHYEISMRRRRWPYYMNRTRRAVATFRQAQGGLKGDPPGIRSLQWRDVLRHVRLSDWVVALVLCGTVLTRADGPPAEGKWKPVSELTDEFAGTTLDATTWYAHDPVWKGREPVFFDPACVRVQDGMLKLTACRPDVKATTNLPSGYTHVSGFVKSRKPVLYGYFEIKAKLMDSSLVSCFWFYNHTPEEWTEIDVFEAPTGVPARRRQFNMNLHLFHSPTHKGTAKDHLTSPKVWTAPSDLAADFHVYGLEWSKDQLRWYVDGQVVRTEPNEHWHQPLFLCLNTEANAHFDALPDDSRLPAAYEIDYVRAWAEERRVP